LTYTVVDEDVDWWSTGMNDVRYKALSVLEAQGKATARELAELLGVRHEAMSMLLLRARRDGLTGYRRRSGRHCLSDRGRERLAWIRGRRA
jgi:transcription initiation factor IIE alpha subunit